MAILLLLLRVGELEASWQWRSPLPQGNDLYALTYADGRFVAVGDCGAILTSSNAVGWAVHSLEQEFSLCGVAYGNGKLVAVGQGYWDTTNSSPGLDVILASPDATNWTPHPTGQTNFLRSVAFGNGLFVAVGSSWGYYWPPTNTILTSPDGVTWTPRHAATNTGLVAVIFAAGRFVAVGESWVHTSVDGVTWSAQPAPAGCRLAAVTFGNGTYAAVGVANPYTWPERPFVVASTNGLDWTPGSFDPPPSLQESMFLTSVAWGDGRFVAMGSRYADPDVNTSWESLDGVTWTRQPDLPTLQRPTAILWASDRFVAIGEFGNISTSPDGVAWTVRSKATSNNLRGIAHGDGTFVAVGNNGTNLSSLDGLSWTPRLSGTSRNLHEATYALGQFVAVGSAGTIVTSPNGEDWAARLSGTGEDLWGVAGTDALLVAVGGDSTGEGKVLHRFSILTSTNGTHWTIRLSSPSYSYNDFELHGITYGNGRFVAVGRPGVIFTSTDGLAWVTNRTAADPFVYLKGIAYGNGVFVAVGETTNAWTSTDGTTWTSRPLPVPRFTQLDQVAFGDGTFVAVGDSGIIVTSTNGTDWSRDHSPTSTSLRGAAYGAGSFVIVGNNEQILQGGTNATPGPLRITVPPRNQLVRPGANVTFTVVAHAAGPVTYQWRRNGTNLLAGDSASLTLRNVQIEDCGYFTVLVSDGVDTLSSEAAFLLVTATDPLDSWTVRVTNSPSALQDVAWGGGQFIAVGGLAAWRSPDGVKWDSNSSPVGGLQAVAFGNGLFVACGGGIATSADGSNWVARSPGAGMPLPLYGVAYGNGRFVAVGSSSSRVGTSLDGITWGSAALPTNAVLLDVTWGDGQFVSVGDPGRIFTSPDGLNWTLRNSGTNTPLYGVVFGHNRFVAVGAPSLILTSPDAVTWTARPDPAPGLAALYDVAFAHDTFVVIRSDGRILTSADGVNWRTQLGAVPGTWGITGGADTFVAVGNQIIQSGSMVPVPPAILAHPQGGVPIVGTGYTLSVAARGVPPPRYQWRCNGADLPTATGSNYTLTSVQITNEGLYTVEVANPFGAVTSDPAEIVAGVPPTFLQHPLSQSVVANGSVTLSAVVTGRPPAFTYIWRHESTALRFTNDSSEPQTFHTYIAPSATVMQRFRVVAINAATTGPGAISDYATVQVLADTDGDGLPDRWEDSFGFSSTNAADGTNDFDLDGLSNRAEYIAGTDPTNALSFLKVEQTTVPGSAAVVFAAASNRTYTVEFTDSLGAGPWVKLADVPARAVDRVEIVPDPHWTARRYYRLVTPWQPAR